MLKDLEPCRRGSGGEMRLLPETALKQGRKACISFSSSLFLAKVSSRLNASRSQRAGGSRRCSTEDQPSWAQSGAERVESK